MTTVVAHPTADFNTFVDVTGADVFANDSLDYRLWEALDTTTKTRWLFHSFNIMMLLPNFIPPDISDTDLGKAQVLIILNDLKYGITADELSQQVRVEKFGSLMLENFKNEFADRLTPAVIQKEAWP